MKGSGKERRESALEESCRKEWQEKTINRKEVEFVRECCSCSKGWGLEIDFVNLSVNSCILFDYLLLPHGSMVYVASSHIQLNSFLQLKK